MVGSMIPFAKNRTEREKSTDPRPSIEERYHGRDEYLRKVDAAAQALVRDRLMLARDVSKVTEKAGARWDSLMNSNASLLSLSLWTRRALGFVDEFRGRKIGQSQGEQACAHGRRWNPNSSIMSDSTQASRNSISPGPPSALFEPILRRISGARPAPVRDTGS